MECDHKRCKWSIKIWIFVEEHIDPKFQLWFNILLDSSINLNLFIKTKLIVIILMLFWCYFNVQYFLSCK